MPDVLTKAYLVIPLSANAELMTQSLYDKFIYFDRMGLVGGATVVWPMTDGPEVNNTSY